jgi:hypothetical protein
MDVNISTQKNKLFNGVKIEIEDLILLKPFTKMPSKQMNIAEPLTEKEEPVELMDEDVIENIGNFDER